MAAITRRVGAWLRVRPRIRVRGERGAAMVEAAIVMPLVLILTFGLIDFGLAFSDAATLRSATRSGARIGAASPHQPTQFKAIVDAVNKGTKAASHTTISDLLVYSIPTGLPASVLTDCGDVPAGGQCVVVPWNEATRQFEPVLPVTWDPNALDACPGTADEIGVTVLSDYHFLTNIVGTHVRMNAGTLIDLEPTTLNTCAGS